MKTLSEMLEQDLFVQDGTSLGKIQAFVFDNVSAKCFVQTEVGTFDVSKIVFRKHTAVCESATPVSLENQGAVPRLYTLYVGQLVYDTNGKTLGQMDDVEIAQNFLLKKLYVGERQIKRHEMTVGEIVLVKEKSAKRLAQEQAKQARLLQQEKQNKQQRLLAALAAKKQPVLTEIAPPATPTPAAEPATPQTAPTGNITDVKQYDSQAAAVSQALRTGKIRRAYGDFNFLIGKTVDKTVVNFQGEVMIHQHDTITKDILRQAKISGKLLELYLHIE